MALSPTSWGTGGGGGGGVPAGNDGEIQYNDAGAFGASPDLVWDQGGGNGTLKLVTTENGTASIDSVGLGAQLQINAAQGDDTHTGGEIGIASGEATGGDGGEVSITAGDDAAAGAGGALSLVSGTSTLGDGGDIDIKANGIGPAGNRGGDINVVAGQGTVHGGNLVLQGGSADGNVQLYAGDSNQAIQLDSTGLNVLATKVGFFGVAPVVQPAAPVTIFDVIAALKALGLVAT